MHSAKCSKSRSGLFCAYCALERHIKQALESPKGVIHPSSIVQNLRQISKSLRPGRQEDSHEFFLRVLDACSTAAKPSPQDSAFLEALFNGRFRSRILCQLCNTPSDCFDPFVDISLDLAGSNTLEDCFKRFTSTEVLQGANAYNCKTCKKKVTARKQFSLDNAPAVITVQLKRFDVSRNIAGKIHRRIAFPAVLDVAPYLAERTSPSLYDLVGVVVHQGVSLSSGHYYSYCRAPSGFWLRCDDESVAQARLETVLSEMSGAYLLFYEKRSVAVICAPTVTMDIETTSVGCGSAGVSSSLINPTLPPLSDDSVTLAARSLQRPRGILLSYSKLYFRPAAERWGLSRRLHLLRVFTFLKTFRVKRPVVIKAINTSKKPAILAHGALVPGLDLPADTRKLLGMSSSSQWGTFPVTSWDDDDSQVKMDETAAQAIQRQLQPLPVQRSPYDADFDKSNRLQHNPAKERSLSTSREFPGSRLFDHAQSFKPNHMRPSKDSRRGRGGFRGRQSRPAI